jgi:isoleucyl-tRNA synthetase
MTESRFPDVPGGYPFPKLELETLAAWKRERVFERTLEERRGADPFVFFEGPPTANNVPHVGHVLTRVVKDLFPRFQTMRGRYVARKAGWDTHGLAVEIEVEKALGLSGKKDIENLVPGDRRASIEAFNRKCFDSVMTYEEKWRAMSERVGYWIDMDDPYFTYSNGYVESVWWSLKTLHEKNLLYEGFKIQPYCARCGTTLSSHEVAQNYKEAEDPSIWTIFRLKAGQKTKSLLGKEEDLGGVGLVGWTTTPWTTIANVAVAVHPELEYKLIEFEGERLIVGKDLGTPLSMRRTGDSGKAEVVDLRDVTPLAVFLGRALEGLTYERLFDFYEPGFDGRVVLGDYVTATDGTGLVHTAPPFGEDDYQTGQRYGLPMILSVEADGKMGPGAGPFAGMWFKEADKEIIRNLRQRKLLLKDERYKHNYPFCWRCDQPLLYFATRSWFVRTTAIRDTLVEKNLTIDWHPEHIKQGRFGNWLENVVDWALSRKRYWGTPLPLWRCDANVDHLHVVGDFAELHRLSGATVPADVYDRGRFDPHRPFIDDVTWGCSAAGCAGTMRRVDDVIDAWYDSGAMPFAQHHYPFENRDQVAPGGTFRPADFIAEAVDQTRGWFYTLHVLACALFDEVAFRDCIVMGHVADDQGKKMSKRLGNVVEPMKVIEETGADAMRWYFYVNDPEQASRFSARLVREAAQNFQIPLWNALSFFTIYANIDGWRPGKNEKIPGGERPFLDRWILRRLEETTTRVSQELEAFQIAPAARALQSLVDDLTNWYIRRSRARFWSGHEGSDKESAYQTLHETLVRIAKLVAPFTPFFAEQLYGHLVGGDSVHLQAWPERPVGGTEARITQEMRSVQAAVELGRAARSAQDLKTRQPLASATLIYRPGLADPELIGPHLAIVQDELNVKEVRFATNRDDFARAEVRPNFRVLGKKVGKHMKAIQAALEASDPSFLTQQLFSEGAVTLTVDNTEYRLTEEDLEIRLIQKEGMATAGDRDLLVALDVHLTPELIAEGRAREVVSRIQAARKDADLDYTDRIAVRYAAAADIAGAIATHRDWIAGETLATRIEAATDTTGFTVAPIDDLEFSFAIERIDRA